MRTPPNPQPSPPPQKKNKKNKQETTTKPNYKTKQKTNKNKQKQQTNKQQHKHKKYPRHTSQKQQIKPYTTPRNNPPPPTHTHTLNIRKATHKVYIVECVHWRSRGYCRPGPNIYGRPYWCSRNTFASEIATPVKVSPGTAAPSPTPTFVPPLNVYIFWGLSMKITTSILFFIYIYFFFNFKLRLNLASF